MKDSAENLVKAILNFQSLDIYYCKDLDMNSFKDMWLMQYLEDHAQKGEQSRMTDIAEEMRVSKSAVTQLVTRMEKRGVIKRYHDKKDRRIVFVKPTDKGREVFADKSQAMLAYIEKLVGRIGEEDSDKLVEILNKILSIVKEENIDVEA